MSETQEVISKNIEGGSVDLSEGVYFIPFTRGGELLWLSLRKENALYSFTLDELTKLQGIVQVKYRELMVIRYKSQIQLDQITVIGNYLEKLKFRIIDLEKNNSSFKSRLTSLSKNLFG